jgi:pimeloyl-ACP methyl ester carboxylesterase
MLKKLIKALSYLLGTLLVILFLLAAIWYRADTPLIELQKKYWTTGSSFISINEDTIHIREQGSGVPIFLLHGSFASLHAWHAWEKDLSKTFKTISIDFPSHGLTGPTKSQRYSTDDYEQLVFNIADYLKIDSFYVAGNSMGGQVAWKMALHQPNRVKKLILVDAAGYWKMTTDSTSKNQSRPFIFRLLQNDMVANTLSKITPKFLFRFNLKQVYGNPAKVIEGDVGRFYDLMMREGNRSATVLRLRQPNRDLQDSIKFIQVPTLIIWGEKDAWIPVSNAHRFNADVVHSQLQIFPGAGHVPMEEIPQETVTAAIEFLQKKPRQDG